MRLPEGYDTVHFGRAIGYARPEASDWVGRVLARGGRLFEDAAGHTQSKKMSGRGDVWAMPSDGDQDRWWVARHYRRGGMVAPLLGDRYLYRPPTRPEIETRAAAIARKRGIATPEVLAGAIYRDGWFYRADLVTELVLDAGTLADAVWDPTPNAAPEESLRMAGSAMAALENAGVLHADFNAANILIRRRGEVTEPWVIDLDRAEIFDTDESFPRGRMRNRLERSLRKYERLHGRALSHAEWSALRDGYEGRA